MGPGVPEEQRKVLIADDPDPFALRLERVAYRA